MIVEIVKRGKGERFKQWWQTFQTRLMVSTAVVAALASALVGFGSDAPLVAGFKFFALGCCVGLAIAVFAMAREA